MTRSAGRRGWLHRWQAAALSRIVRGWLVGCFAPRAGTTAQRRRKPNEAARRLADDSPARRGGRHRSAYRLPDFPRHRIHCQTLEGVAEKSRGLVVACGRSRAYPEYEGRGLDCGDRNGLQRSQWTAEIAMAADVLSIDPLRFNNPADIRERVQSAETSDRGPLQTALPYLYWDCGPTNLPRDRLKTTERYLDEAERVLLRWLYTRTNGSERKNYGKAALIAARRSQYRCEGCGFSDVRALNLDHVEGRTGDTPFACLCANCHTIKSRQRDWTGRTTVSRASGRTECSP